MTTTSRAGAGAPGASEGVTRLEGGAEAPGSSLDSPHPPAGGAAGPGPAAGPFPEPGGGDEASVEQRRMIRTAEALEQTLAALAGRARAPAGAGPAPGQAEALRALELQLAALAGSLERSKEWIEGRHTRLEARFDGVEGRLDQLGEAVGRSQQAIQGVAERTASQIGEAMRQTPSSIGLNRIERDVRVLSVAAREQEERSAEGMAELHGALRLVLDQLASMGQKLSGVDDLIEETRDRRRTAGAPEDGVRAPGDGRVLALRAGGGETGGVVTRFERRAGASPEPRGARLALAGALAILLATGVTLFVRHLSATDANELAGGGSWSVGQARTPAPGADLTPSRERLAARSGLAEGEAPVESGGGRAGQAVAGLFGGDQMLHALERGGARQGGGVQADGGEPTGGEPADLPVSLGTESVRLAAISGVPAAQYIVASHYETGQGVGRDAAAAARWFRRAAEHHHAPSQYRLATLYERGSGVEKDMAAAERLYRSAAGQGNVKAMHNLGVLLINRKDEPTDYPAAAKLFRQAADHGFSDSQYNLAILYEQGLGVGRDLLQAYRWFALCARSGDAQAAAQRDRLRPRLPGGARLDVDAALARWRPRPVMEAANRVEAAMDAAQDGRTPASLMPAVPSGAPPSRGGELRAPGAGRSGAAG